MLRHSSKPIEHLLALLPTHAKPRVTSDPAYRERFIPVRHDMGYPVNPRHQRSMVKVSYSKNTATRSWAAHGAYLQREHAQEKGQKGLGFNMTNEEVDIKTTLRAWQAADDEHFFRVIVSPENGNQLDLKKHTQSLIQQMEHDLKTQLEWVAIDHYNTDHPHCHLLVRGRDEKGKTFRIDREYLSVGLRHRSAALATRELGLRQSREQMLAFERQIEANYLTPVDYRLEKQAVNSIVDFSIPVLEEGFARDWRLLEVKRIRSLEKMGLAKRIQKKSWELVPHLKQTLKALQLSNDIIKSRAAHQIPTFGYHDLAPTVLEVGESLTGRVIGMGLANELYDSRYLLLEDEKQKIHYLKATPKMVKARDAGEFKNNDTITLEKKEFTNYQGQQIQYIHIHPLHTQEKKKSQERRLEHTRQWEQ